MEELRHISIHRALNRPNLFLGGEREWVLFTGLIAFTLIAGVMSLASALVGIIFWFSSLALLRRMGKADPMLSKIYFRQVQRQTYYPARTRVRGL